MASQITRGAADPVPWWTALKIIAHNADLEAALGDLRGDGKWMQPADTSRKVDTSRPLLDQLPEATVVPTQGRGKGQ
jgi:hypothetical protein